MSIQWHGEEVFDIIRARAAVRVEEAAEGLALAMKDEIDFACPKYNGVPGGKHAPEFRPPYREKGELYNSVQSKMVDTENPTAIVGSFGVEYALELEMGSGRVLPHPWCLPALIKNKEYLRQRISGSGSIPF